MSVPVGFGGEIVDSSGRGEVLAPARFVKVKDGTSEGGGPEKTPVGGPEKEPVSVGFAGGVPDKAEGELSAAGAA